MNVLVFHIGQDRFGLPLADVVRVLPAALLTPVPGAPSYVAGLLDLRGAPVPVLDLTRLAQGQSAPVRYNTRILLVDYPLPGGGSHLLGLEAERVSGVIAVAEDAMARSGIAAAPFLGVVAHDDGGLVQLVTIRDLLGEQARALLFASMEPA